MSIGAYYQCYKRRPALRFVLESYRAIYPGSSIVLVADGGLDFTSEATEFNCHYFYEDKLDVAGNLVFNNVESTATYVRRLAKYIHSIDEEFFILLEDDVLVLKEVSIKDLKFDINGCNKNEFLSPGAAMMLRRYNAKLLDWPQVYYGACGGCVLRTSFFKEILEDDDRLMYDIKEYCLVSDQQLWASDGILSYMCWKHGGSIGEYRGFCETWYPDVAARLESNDVEVLHQYKEFYHDSEDD